MEEELLEGIIASVFFIVVAIIGFYLPNLASEFFQSHNPYLVLEAAGFLTYSTSEPGNISTVIPMTQFADPYLEFRIIPPINTGWSLSAFDNSDTAVAIGYCIPHNLYQQIFGDAINSLMNAIFSYAPGGEVAQAAEEGGLLGSVALTKLGRIAGNVFAANLGISGVFSFTNSFLGYESNGGNLIQNFATSFQASLSQNAIFTAENVGETVLDVILYASVATGPEGFAVAFAVDFTINAAVTLIQYQNVQSNEYARCYHYNPGPGDYYVYNNLLFFPVYYNPQFDIYDLCSVPQLCNNQKSITQYSCQPTTSYNNKYRLGNNEQICIPENIQRGPLAYDSSNTNNDYIIKIELGYYDQTSGLYYFPSFLVLNKVGNNQFGYINVNILYETQG